MKRKLSDGNDGGRKKIKKIDLNETLQCLICQDPSLYHVQFSCAHTICVFCYNNWRKCSWEAQLRIDMQGKLRVDLNEKSIPCPLCKDSGNGGTAVVGMAPLILYNILEQVYPEDPKDPKDPKDTKETTTDPVKDSDPIGHSLRVRKCPYCLVAFSDNLHATTLHLLTCPNRKVNCPKCEQEIAVGSTKNLELHFENECTYLMQCPFCRGTHEDRNVPLCGYDQHFREMHHQHHEIKDPFPNDRVLSDVLHSLVSSLEGGSSRRLHISSVQMGNGFPLFFRGRPH